MGPTDSLQSAARRRQSKLLTSDCQALTNRLTINESPTNRDSRLYDSRLTTPLRRPSFEKRAELPAAGGVAQLPERLGLDLPDALARDGEALSDLFQRVLAPVPDAEPHLDHFLLARRQRLEDRFGLLLQVQVDD